MRMLTILSLMAMLILSGCIGNTDNKDGTQTSTLNSSVIGKTNISDSIVGKWAADNESIEFFKEGKMILSQKNENPVIGSYKFDNNNQIIISIENLGTNVVWKIVNISDNESVIFTGKYDVKFSRIINNKETSSMSDTGKNTNVGTEWCKPGANVTENNNVYTVVGITTYGDKDNVCKAERPIKGGSSIIYFNKEYVNKEPGALFVENSTSSGGNARADASSYVKVGN